MYFLQTNKKEKTYIGLFLSLIIIFSSAVTSWAAYDEVSSYPVYRGLINPQENMKKLNITDANGDSRLYFAVGLGLMSAPNSKFNPSHTMSEMEALAAIVNATGMETQIEIANGNWKTGYIEMATSLGIITEEEQTLGLSAPDAPFSNLITAEKFNRWLSSAIKVQSAYTADPDNTVTRSNAASAFYNNKEKIAELKGYTLIKGEIVDQKTVTEDSKNKQVTTIKQDAGGFINLLSENNIPVIKDGNLSRDITLLSKGERANIYYKDSQTQFTISEYINFQNTSGIFQSLTGDTITITDFEGKIKTYKTHPDMVILEAEGEIGNKGKTRPIQAKDLIFNQDVELAVKNNLVHEITSYIPRDSDLDGYIPPESRLITGVVLDVTQNYITFTDSKMYIINSDTFILKDSVLSDYRDIKEGDRVKLFFDDIYSITATRVEVEGQQRQADTIIKGTIDSYSSGRGELVIKSVSQLNGDRWVEADKSYTKLKLNGTVYDGNKKVTTSKLKDYKDQEIYALLAKNQNNPTIEKANIRRGAAVSFSEEISKVDFPGSYLNIETNLINFTEGTLIVKDGRIVTTGNLQEKVGAYVESGTNKNASLIVMSNTQYSKDATDYPYKIYRGTVQDIFDYSILLNNDKSQRHYYLMTGAKWDTVRATKDSPRIAYTDNTVIYDSDFNKGQGKVIEVRDFRDSKYEGSKYDITPNYFDRQVYVVTRDDVAVSINFLSQTGYTEVNTQNVMTAKVAEFNEEARTFTVKEVSKYNALRGIFVSQQTTEVIDISKASIIKGSNEVPKRALGELVDKKVKIVYKQNTTKANNAIAVIVE